MIAVAIRWTYDFCKWPEDLPLIWDITEGFFMGIYLYGQDAGPELVDEISDTLNQLHADLLHDNPNPTIPISKFRFDYPSLHLTVESVKPMPAVQLTQDQLSRCIEEVHSCYHDRGPREFCGYLKEDQRPLAKICVTFEGMEMSLASPKI